MPLAPSHIAGEPASFARQDQRRLGVCATEGRSTAMHARTALEHATIVETKTSGRANQAGTRDLCLPSSQPRLLGAPFRTARVAVVFRNQGMRYRNLLISTKPDLRYVPEKQRDRAMAQGY